MKKIIIILLIFAIIFSISTCCATAQTHDDAYNVYNQGSELYNKKDYNGAIKKYEEALNIYKKLNDMPNAIFCITGIAFSYSSAGNYQESIRYHLQALDIHNQLNDMQGQANDFENIADCYFSLNDNAKVLEYNLNALDIYKQIGNKQEQANKLTAIGNYYNNIKDYEKAKKHYEEALKLHRELGDKEAQSFDILNIKTAELNINTDKIAAKAAKTSELMKKAGDCFLSGQYQKSWESYLQILKIYKDTNDKKGEALAYSSIANLYFLLSNFEGAINYRLLALKIYKEIGDKEKELDEIKNLALLYSRLGKDSKSLEYSDIAAASAKEKLKEDIEKNDKPAQSNDLSGLGLIYLNSGKYEEAVNYIQQALAINKELKNRGMVEVNLLAIGVAYCFLKQYDKAIDYYKQALSISKESADKLLYPSHLFNIGNAYEYSGKYNDALNYYLQALKIFKESGFPDNIFWASWCIARTYKKMNKDTEALTAYKDTIDMLEKMRAGAGSEKLQSSMMKDKLQVYDEMIELLLKMKKDREAFQYSERLKARTLVELLINVKITNAEGVSPDLKKKEEEISIKIRGIYKQIYDELNKAPDARDKNLLRSLGAELKKSQEELEGILEQIKTTNPSYASLKGNVMPVKEEDVQKFLDKDAALLEYIITDDKLILWVINKKEIYPAIVTDINKDHLAEKVLDFRQSFEDLKDSSKVVQTGQLNILKQFKLITAEELYNILIKPAEKYLAGSKRIIIVPDGILNYLPFEALVCRRIEKTQGDDILFSKYSGAEYLIEKYAVSYLPSAALLDPKIRKGVRESQAKFIGFGSPSYTSSKENKEEASSELRGSTFAELKYSKEEVQGIKKTWQGKDNKVYYDKDANEGNAKKDIKNYNYIHFSTHGMLDEQNPLFSGIVLTQPDPSGNEDGFLETYEIFNMPISAELVVLSACETGLGKIQRGEGVVGLTRAFMYAGASNIVVTMWSVEDRASNELMKSFYENMITKKEEKAEALRQAKLKLMKEVAVLGEGSNQIKILYSHPFFWAPFVLIGEGK